MEMIRPSRDENFLEIAKCVAKRATCIRRKYGAVIVDENNRIVSTGYNGSPRGCINCEDTGKCLRRVLNVPHGERYELCAASPTHAETNACLNAGANNTVGCTLYLYGLESATGEPLNAPECCLMCKRVLVNCQLKEVVRYNNGEIEHIPVERFKDAIDAAWDMNYEAHE